MRHRKEFLMSVKWVPLKEACHLLDISESTLRRRITQGIIKAKGEGRERRVAIESDAEVTFKNSHYLRKSTHSKIVITITLSIASVSAESISDKLAKFQNRAGQIWLKLPIRVFIHYSNSAKNSACCNMAYPV